jgi:hypothetical protein
MNSSLISQQTEERIALLFPHEWQRALVRAALSEQPFVSSSGEAGSERLQFAALKLSEGNLDKLNRAVALAKTDWRDLLMAAGFGEDIKAHLAWPSEQT